MAFLGQLIRILCYHLPARQRVWHRMYCLTTNYRCLFCHLKCCYKGRPCWKCCTLRSSDFSSYYSADYSIRNNRPSFGLFARAQEETLALQTVLIFNSTILLYYHQTLSLNGEGVVFSPLFPTLDTEYRHRSSYTDISCVSFFFQ